VAGLFGVLSGYLCLRLRGSYLSLATLAFPLIALGHPVRVSDFSGGELGVSGLRRLMPSATGNYYVAVVSMLVVVFALWTLADSKFGIVLHAIRDDEVAARASGINTPRYKLGVFAVSAAAAGIRGSAVRALSARRRALDARDRALVPGRDLGRLRRPGHDLRSGRRGVHPLSAHRVARQLRGIRRAAPARFAVIVLLVLLFMPRASRRGCATGSRPTARAASRETQAGSAPAGCAVPLP
jgi:hypothetical protein